MSEDLAKYNRSINDKYITYKEDRIVIDGLGAIKSSSGLKNLMKCLKYLDMHTGIIPIDIAETKIYSLKTMCRKEDSSTDFHSISPTEMGFEYIGKNASGRIFTHNDADFRPDTFTLTQQECLELGEMRTEDLFSFGVMFGFTNHSYDPDADEDIPPHDVRNMPVYYVIPHGTFLNDFMKRAFGLGCVKEGASYYRDMYIADLISAGYDPYREIRGPKILKLKLLVRLYPYHNSENNDVDCFALGLTAFSEKYEYISTLKATETILETIEGLYGSYDIGNFSVSNNKTVIQIIARKGREYDFGFKFCTSDTGDSSHRVTPAIFDKKHNMICVGKTVDVSHKGGLDEIRNLAGRMKLDNRLYKIFTYLNSEENEEETGKAMTLKDYLVSQGVWKSFSKLPKKAVADMTDDRFMVSGRREAIRNLFSISTILKNREIEKKMKDRQSKLEALIMPRIYDNPYMEIIDFLIGEGITDLISGT